MLFAGGLVARIPLAALAGVLMVTACRMVEIHNVRAVVRATRSDAIVLVLTTVATITFDLVVAVEVGVVVAGALALRHIARASEARWEPLVGTGDPAADDSDLARLRRERIVVYRLDGALFFGAAQWFLTELTGVTDVRVVILDLSRVQVLDATGAQALGEIVAELEGRGITVLLTGVRPVHRRILSAVGAFEHLAHENHLFEATDAAVAHARAHVTRTHPALSPAAPTGGPPERLGGTGDRSGS